MTKRNNWEPDWLRKWNPAAVEPSREPTPEEIEQQKLIDAAVDAICAPTNRRNHEHQGMGGEFGSA